MVDATYWSRKKPQHIISLPEEANIGDNYYLISLLSNPSNNGKDPTSRKSGVSLYSKARKIKAKCKKKSNQKQITKISYHLIFFFYF